LPPSNTAQQERLWLRLKLERVTEE
jgi:hypothetical protein